MIDFLEACFSWPALPATMLLFLCCMYWLLVIIGALDLEFLNADLDGGDADVNLSGGAGGALGFGFVALRWFNLGQVPLMLWLSAFALAWWSLAMWDFWPEPTVEAGRFWPVIYESIGNVTISLLVTKLVTQPLRGRFDLVEPNRAEDLIGRICVITTAETTPGFGQARLETDAAPLLLHVRTQDETLLKGDAAEIIDYDSDRRIYFVTKAMTNAIGDE